MQFKTFIAFTLLLLTTIIAGCGSDTSNTATNPVGGNERWVSTYNNISSVSNVNTDVTLTEDISGKLSASGDWNIVSKGFNISCTLTQENTTFTLTKNKISITATGEATATGGGNIGTAYLKFKLTATGSYLNGEINNGFFTVTFTKDSSKSPNAIIPPVMTYGWLAQRQSGSNVTYIAPVGNYSGSFSGGDSGTWTFSVDQYGNIEGKITSNNYKKTTYWFGSHEPDSSIHLQDSLDPSNTYKGTLVFATGAISGTWRNPNPHNDTSGTFSGSRL
jgi:hypothetical protein